MALEPRLPSVFRQGRDRPLQRKGMTVPVEVLAVRSRRTWVVTRSVAFVP